MSSFIGDEALIQRDFLDLKYPMKHGVVTSWDDMEKIWRYIFQEQLHVQSQDQTVLLTEPPLNPTSNRQHMLEVMFENFNVPAVHVEVGAVLSLYATGRMTGCVLDSGDGVTCSVPIFEGAVIKHATSRLNVAGSDLTSNLMKIMMERGYKCEEG